MVNVIDSLISRGLVDRLTDEGLGALSTQRQLTLYCGFDPTAASLHVGNFLPIMLLSSFQRAGHRPIALVGGATGLIGDPSGKKDERKLQTLEQVQENVAGIRQVLERFLDFDGPNAAQVVNNHDWIGPISFLDFIRDVGKHARITEMMARESVKARLDSGAGLSFTEFSYQLVQAYDFWHLHKNFQCDLQVGGSDQWGNITAGTDLIRRLGGDQTYGLVCPLLTTADGNKFGKSEQGAIWLTSDRTSPYQFYQFWMRTDDRDVVKFLKLFTFIAMEEIEQLAQSVEQRPEQREAQQRLAWDITVRVHGVTAAEQARNASSALFSGDLAGLDRDTILDVFAEVPSFEFGLSRVQQGYPIADVLVESGLCQSKGEARRAVRGGGVYLNSQRISDENHAVSAENLLHGELLVVRMGKKKYSLGKMVQQ